MNRFIAFLKLLLKDAAFVVISLIVAMFILGILHTYFPNNPIGKVAEWLAQKTQPASEGL